MSEKVDLIDRLKLELASLGPLDERGLALITKEGDILYSDLPSDVEQKILLFKSSFPGLTIGSNITLTAKPRSVIVMCTSEKMLMAVQTKQSVGFTLVKLSTIAKNYADDFEKYADTARQEIKNKTRKRKSSSEVRKKPRKKKSKPTKKP
nr:hypothetical protein [Candidatus Freyarchaeota archaeon]